MSSLLSHLSRSSDTQSLGLEEKSPNNGFPAGYDIGTPSPRADHSAGCRELSRLFEVHLALIEATSLEDVIGVQVLLEDRLETVRNCAQSVTLTVSIRNAAAEIRLRLQRKAGQILHELHLRGGDRRSKFHAEILKLEKLRISRNQSFRWQQVAAIPAAIFDEYVRVWNQLNKEMNAASLLRFAHRHLEQSSSSQNGTGEGDLKRVLRELGELVSRHRSFSCISIDPPWPTPREIGRNAMNYVDTNREFLLLLEQIPIGELAAKNAFIHLRSTSDRLWDAMSLLHTWKITYRGELVVKKPLPQYGPFWQMAHDDVLLATKGNVTFQDNRFPSVIEGDMDPLRQANRIRDLIERVSPAPYLAIFGATARPHWTVVR